ncbi:3-phytase [Niastella yeongjuensis]|uniref:3-phytase n=1 Tax=Niastella yeongjuensis TaxID=354355 RepID=A0A1V9EEM4_9BACT|nr:phytase [Niastella yeongjuensis]OQP44501.1 3-phytase [Niastella yeongjuensis]SEO85530.1 3-phytase [Niastella yeongjuensis]
MKRDKWVAGVLILTVFSCHTQQTASTLAAKPDQREVKPLFITEKVAYDSDDPAVWVNRQAPSQSLIIGTDKDINGAVYVFDLTGKIIKEKTVKGLKRPNNVDIEYSLLLNGKPVDIAVVTERFTHKLRVFTLPDMKAVDNGGLDMFVGDDQPEFRDLMGIALYRDKSGKVFAFVGRKTGPPEGYLGQYLLEDDGTGHVKASLVRKFGSFSGKKEIEAIAVDDALGYVYYSDEGVGVKQYYADADKGNEQLSIFGTSGFSADHEGISIYPLTDSTGYILVSDQGANRFRIFSREGKSTPYDHPLLKTVNVRARQSDGSEVVALPLGTNFPKGLFVAMSTDRTFHLYKWEDIAGTELSAIP